VKPFNNVLTLIGADAKNNDCGSLVYTCKELVEAWPVRRSLLTPQPREVANFGAVAPRHLPSQEAVTMRVRKAVIADWFNHSADHAVTYLHDGCDFRMVGPRR